MNLQGLSGDFDTFVTTYCRVCCAHYHKLLVHTDTCLWKYIKCGVRSVAGSCADCTQKCHKNSTQTTAKNRRVFRCAQLELSFKNACLSVMYCARFWCPVTHMTNVVIVSAENTFWHKKWQLVIIKCKFGRVCRNFRAFCGTQRVTCFVIYPKFSAHRITCWRRAAIVHNKMSPVPVCIACKKVRKVAQKTPPKTDVVSGVHNSD